MSETCTLAVFAEMNSSAAISRLLLPLAPAGGGAAPHSPERPAGPACSALPDLPIALGGSQPFVDLLCRDGADKFGMHGVLRDVVADLFSPDTIHTRAKARSAASGECLISARPYLVADLRRLRTS